MQVSCTACNFFAGSAITLTQRSQPRSFLAFRRSCFTFPHALGW